MNLRTEKPPGAGRGVLPEGEDVYVVRSREPLDEPEARVDDTILATRVDAAADDDCDLHTRAAASAS